MIFEVPKYKKLLCEKYVLGRDNTKQVKILFFIMVSYVRTMFLLQICSGLIFVLSGIF